MVFGSNAKRITFSCAASRCILAVVQGMPIQKRSTGQRKLGCISQKVVANHLSNSCLDGILSVLHVFHVYYTMQNHHVFQSSKEFPGSATSSTAVVRDPHLGLQHIFIVRSIVGTQSTTYKIPEAIVSIVFGQSHI